MIKNILVTGANGFIGKNVVNLLKDKGFAVFSYDLGNTEDELISYIVNADFIIHLAGINRPLTTEEFYDGNTNFTKHLVDLVKASNKKIPIIYSSSIHASKDNDYGKSKKLAEDYLLQFAKEYDNQVYIFRLTNVYGRGSRPNYNSAVATFAYNVINNLPITVDDPEREIHLVFVGDVAREFYLVINGTIPYEYGKIYEAGPIKHTLLKVVVDTLNRLHDQIKENYLPVISDEFEYQLFLMLIEFMKTDKYNYNFAKDDRGSFEEIYKSDFNGQISINVGKRNVLKGGHYHTRKYEVFQVVKGVCLIRLRNIKNPENVIIEHLVTGDESKQILIEPYWTHDITNVGASDSVTLMWISETYDPNDPDTFYEPVEPKKEIY